MKHIEVKSLIFHPAVEYAKVFLNAYDESHSSSYRETSFRSDILGTVTVNGHIIGALLKKINMNNPNNKEPFIYAMANSEGMFELDSDQVKAAMDSNSGQAVKKRNLSITDSDHYFLTQLGAGNASAGLRVAVEIAKLSRSQYHYSTI